MAAEHLAEVRVDRGALHAGQLEPAGVLPVQVGRGAPHEQLQEDGVSGVEPGRVRALRLRHRGQKHSAADLKPEE